MKLQNSLSNKNLPSERKEADHRQHRIYINEHLSACFTTGCTTNKLIVKMCRTVSVVFLKNSIQKSARDDRIFEVSNVLQKGLDNGIAVLTYYKSRQR